MKNRLEEEIQTLQRFIENRGEKFNSPHACYYELHPEVKEPCDISYKGVEYQITYGDRKHLADIRKAISVNGAYSGMRGISETDYAKILLETALDNKKNKSDNQTTLLIDCIYTSWNSLTKRSALCQRYFKDNENRSGGLWQHIFVIFSDGNIRLR